MNNRYVEIFKIKVDNFLTEMDSSRKLYEDVSKHNNLLHAGEYGMYKERSLREFLKFIIPYKYEITDGYLINSLNETSTQCDLIVFDKLNTPLIEFGNRFQFIPVESVGAIGEVKSVLSKNEFFDAVIKLSKTKAICTPSEESVRLNPLHKKELFSPFAFLICDEVKGINNDFTFNDLVKDLAKHYSDEKIAVNNFFNIIICLSQNKAIGYRTSQALENPDVVEGTKIYYPHIWGMDMNGSIVNCADQYTLLREFATALSSNLHHRQMSFPDPGTYFW